MARRQGVEYFKRAPQQDVMQVFSEDAKILDQLGFHGGSGFKDEKGNFRSTGIFVSIRSIVGETPEIDAALERQRDRLTRMKRARSSNGFMLLQQREWVAREYRQVVQATIDTIGF